MRAGLPFFKGCWEESDGGGEVVTGKKVCKVGGDVGGMIDGV